MKKQDLNKLKNEQFLESKKAEDGVSELRGGVLYRVLSSGDPDSKVPNPRSVVTCHYKGSTINGRVFDETFSKKVPAAFRVNELISGFQIALVNMHVGDHWEVYIPSEMGYGSRGAGDIPKNATLIFEIKLVDVY